MQRKPTSQTKTTGTKDSRAPRTEAAKPKFEASKSKATPTRDDIALRAYEIYVARGKGDGGEMEDWAQAERELLGASHRNN
jgi:hypothetical protein